MSEDPPSSQPARSWFGRLTQALSGEVTSREELLEELRDARGNGLLSNDTLSMIEGAIHVSDLKVWEVMIPRAQMVSIDIDAPFDEILTTVIESGHSRFPVHGDDRDEVLGILLAKDLLRCFKQGTAQDIRHMLRPASLIPESKRLNILLKEFRLSHNHMAVVVDEYGGVSGLVTIEDVLEQIVGDIDDEHDDDDDPKQNLIVAMNDGRYLVNGQTTLAEFDDRFESGFAGENADTIGNFLVTHFEHVPEVNEETTLGGLHFRVTKADGRRLQQVAVRVYEA